MLAEQDSEREATWRERALNAEDPLKAAHTEVLTQRTRIGELLGEIRDVQDEWTEEAIQRITTLEQRIRQLTADNRTLGERLKAGRSNLRLRTGASPTSKPASSTRDPRPDFATRPAFQGPDRESGRNCSWSWAR